MRIIIQRVSKASLAISGDNKANIDQGLLLLVGIGRDDNKDDVNYAVSKIVNMRIFSDPAGKMNLSVQDIGGEILCVSQFTLFANTRKGNRPSFTKAAPPEMALSFYESFKRDLSRFVPVKTGEFGADMQVSLTNDGPVTIILDTKNK